MNRDDVEKLIAELPARPLERRAAGEIVGRANALAILEELERQGCSIVGPLGSATVSPAGSRLP